MKKSVLVIGLDEDDSREHAAILSRSDLNVEQLPGGAHAIDRLAMVEYDVVVVAYPLEPVSIAELLVALRDATSASRGAHAILYVNDADIDAARRLVAIGATRVVPRGKRRAALQEAIAELLEVAPRAAERLPVRLRVLALAGPASGICHTVNLSRTGMLLESSCRYAPGARVDFELDLPEESQSCNGIAEIVRVATEESDGLVGFALHFLVFESGGQERLESFLARSLNADSSAEEHHDEPRRIAVG